MSETQPNALILERDEKRRQAQALNSEADTLDEQLKALGITEEPESAENENDETETETPSEPSEGEQEEKAPEPKKSKTTKKK